MSDLRFYLHTIPQGLEVCSLFSVIQAYSTQDARLLNRVDVPLKGVYGIAVSTDGRFLANAAADGKVRVWEIGNKDISGA